MRSRRLLLARPVRADPRRARRHRQRFGLHPLAVEDALKANQLPKVEAYGEQLFVVASTGNRDGDTIQSAKPPSSWVVTSSRPPVTGRRGRTARCARLELAVKLAHGPDYVLYAIPDFIVDGYFPVIDAIEDRLLTVEESVMDTPLDADDIRHLYGQRHEIVRFQRLVGLMKDVASRLTSDADLPCIDDASPFPRHSWGTMWRAEFCPRRIARCRGVGRRHQQSARTAAAGRDHAPACGLGCHFGRAHGDRGHLRSMNFEHMPESRLDVRPSLRARADGSVCALLYWRFRDRAGSDIGFRSCPVVAGAAICHPSSL